MSETKSQIIPVVDCDSPFELRFGLAHESLVTRLLRVAITHWGHRAYTVVYDTQRPRPECCKADRNLLFPSGQQFVSA